MEYHKIQTVWKRGPDNHHKTLLNGAWAKPEFDYLQNNMWDFTEKVDGTNMRAIWNGESVVIGGKTDRAQIPSKMVTVMVNLFDTTPARATFKELFQGSAVTLYGEGYGAGIQKGGIYGSNQQFILFDVRVEKWWLSREDVLDIALKFNLRVVPHIGAGTLRQMIQNVQYKHQSQWGDFPLEGIVARPRTELCSRDGERVITKVKCKDFPDAPAG